MRSLAPMALMAAALLVATACSGKREEQAAAQDELRIGLATQIVAIDDYHDVSGEQFLLSYAVYDRLIHRDWRDGQFKPLLARSWSWIDPLTLELQLREDVKFHSGARFDADDVVYMVQWAKSPATRITGKSRFAWIDRVEKTGPFTVRFVSREPVATALNSLATTLPIFDAETHAKLANKADYGRVTPVGTGPYRAVQVDRVKGVILERVEGRTHGGDWNVASNIRRIVARPAPDEQTRITMLMTGDLHVAAGLHQDQVQALLREHPDLDVTVADSVRYAYLSFDSINRSGRKELSDERVRRALLMAVDRTGLARQLMNGGAAPSAADAMCVRLQAGCDYGTQAPPYDVAVARSLLVDAGYGDGFEAQITTGEETKELAEAVAGELRKVGVVASVVAIPAPALRRKRSDGKVEIFLGVSGYPDVNADLNSIFGNDAYDYWRDPIVDDAHHRGARTLDAEERKQIYRVLYDRLNEKAYMARIATLRSSLLHSDKVVVHPNPFSVAGAELRDYSWAR